MVKNCAGEQEKLGGDREERKEERRSATRAKMVKARRPSVTAAAWTRHCEQLCVHVCIGSDQGRRPSAKLLVDLLFMTDGSFSSHSFS